jgi:hypothetical protein
LLGADGSSEFANVAPNFGHHAVPIVHAGSFTLTVVVPKVLT